MAHDIVCWSGCAGDYGASLLKSVNLELRPALPGCGSELVNWRRNFPFWWQINLRRSGPPR